MPRISFTAPKLERMQQSENSRFYSGFSFEQRLALRYLLLEAEKAGRTTVTWREFSKATGIPMIELRMRLAKARLPEIAPDTKLPGTSPGAELEAKEPLTKPKTKKANKVRQPSDGASAARKAAVSAEPPPQSKKSSQPKPAPKPSR